MHTPLTPSEIIDALGGTVKTAELCEVSAAAVSQWRLKGIPKAQLKYLMLAKPALFPRPKRKRRESPP